LHAVHTQLRKTALREAKILKQLQHPNVVRLLELFRSKTKLFMVFEFVDKSILRLLVRVQAPNLTGSAWRRANTS
jgi:serine/threonine protein kinase